MKTQKSITSLVHSLENDQWLILPSQHQSMMQHATVAMPMDDEDEDDTDEMPMEDKLATVDGIAFIPVTGVISKRPGVIEQLLFGAVDVDFIADQLNKAMVDPLVTSVVLFFDTPGGTVVGVPELANLINTLKATKPIIAYTDRLCASAGYYLASQCSAIYCSPSSTLGSVGVVQVLVDRSKALADAGIVVNPIYHGKYKVSGAPYRELSEDERSMFQAGVDKTYNEFKNAILRNRQIDAQYLEGQTFDGDQAVDINMADGLVNSIDELLQFLTKG